MSDHGPVTHRVDLYYIQTKASRTHTRERVVSPLYWWFNRLQFWRFKKLGNKHILRERKLD